MALAFLITYIATVMNWDKDTDASMTREAAGAKARRRLIPAVPSLAIVSFQVSGSCVLSIPFLANPPVFASQRTDP